MAAFASPAAALPSTTVMFDFNNNNATSPIDLNCICSMAGPGGASDPVGASNLTIANYMTRVLQSAGYTNVMVSVSGGIGQMGAPPNSTANKSSAGASYTGDGHAIRDPGVVRPVTLADTEHYISGVTNQSSYPDPDGAGPDSAGYDSGAGFTSADGNTTTIAANQPTASDGYIKNCTGTDKNNAGASTCSPLGYTGGSAGTNATTNESSDILISFGSYTGGVYHNYLTDVAGNKFQISSIAFDYELFPDGACVAPNCGPTNLPDLTVYAGDKDSGGVALTGGHFTAPNSNPGGSSPAMGTETAPQLLGVAILNTPINNANSNVLDFVDWPATIGVDNLKIYTNQIPEPGTLVLFGFGLLGLAGIARRRRASSVG